MGAVHMDDAVEPGGGQAGGEAGGSGFTATFDDWPDEDEAEAVPRRQPASGRGGLLRRAAYSGWRSEASRRPGLVRQLNEEA